MAKRRATRNSNETSRRGGAPRSVHRTLDKPVFAQPEPTPDPSVFKVKHPSDDAAYKLIDELNAEHKIHPLAFPAPRGAPEPRLTLEQVFGGNTQAIARIESSGQIVFHSTGDCQSTGPEGVNGLRVRVWMCMKCGELHDRDINAAKNILSAGRSPPSVVGNESPLHHAPPNRASRPGKARSARCDGGMSTGSPIAITRRRYWPWRAAVPTKKRL